MLKAVRFNKLQGGVCECVCVCVHEHVHGHAHAQLSEYKKIN